MINLGSRILFVTSALSLVAALVYASQSTDRLGIAVLFGAAILSGVLGAAGIAGTGAADRYVFTGDIDPSRSVAVPSSFAPICAALGAGCVVGGAALGAPFWAAGAVILAAAGVGAFVSAGREGPAYVPAVARRVSDGITVPFGLPVAVTGLIAVTAISISRTLLAVSKTASWIIVLIFAAAVFFGGIILASRPKISRRMMVAALTVTVLSVGAMGGAGLISGKRSFHHHEKGGEGHSSEKGESHSTDKAVESK
jgi:hypothetical protein